MNAAQKVTAAGSLLVLAVPLLFPVWTQRGVEERHRYTCELKADGSRGGIVGPVSAPHVNYERRFVRFLFGRQIPPAPTPEREVSRSHGLVSIACEAFGDVREEIDLRATACVLLAVALACASIYFVLGANWRGAP